MTTHDLFGSESENASTMELRTSLLDGAGDIYVKKMSLNDWQWTQDPDKHQGGPYIPRGQGFRIFSCACQKAAEAWRA